MIITNSNYKALAILLFLAMVCVGCGNNEYDEEDEIKNPSEMLVGRWKLVKVGDNNLKSSDIYYLTLNADSTFIREYYDSDNKSMISETRNYKQLDDWTYDETNMRFSTYIQIGSTHYVCFLKNKEMVLDPVYPSFAPMQENPWRRYYIKIH